MRMRRMQTGTTRSCPQLDIQLNYACRVASIERNLPCQLINLSEVSFAGKECSDLRTSPTQDAPLGCVEVSELLQIGCVN